MIEEGTSVREIGRGRLCVILLLSRHGGEAAGAALDQSMTQCTAAPGSPAFPAARGRAFPELPRFCGLEDLLARSFSVWFFFVLVFPSTLKIGSEDWLGVGADSKNNVAANQEIWWGKACMPPWRARRVLWATGPRAIRIARRRKFESEDP
ncbi:hypothetical protein BDV98DRAFT_569779 [Pterulicium gracile]|uniref:Uncharacterized protein n=1 Tax=Pterulicium gracile TaxID=1884261 RepID=A0A5C3QED0_9AGAR|nr:hypothetical protein BDV98DRAFT_569779 [Pterula gracilis]